MSTIKTVTNLPVSLRQKFVDDFRLPIKIIDSPYFEHFIDLYKDEFKIEEKLNKFITALDALGEVELKAQWYKIKDQIYSDISSLPKFKDLQETIFNNKKSSFENGNPYNMDSIGKSCVSVDIITGNYTALKHFDSSLSLGTNNYKELISRYTPFEYFHDSKIFRQLIFEPLLAKKQGQIQKSIILETAEHLKTRLDFIKIRTVSNDELVLVFKESNLKNLENQVRDALAEFSHNKLLKTEAFNVKHITKDYFYKENSDGSFLLRKAPGQLYAQLFKKVKGLPVTEEDLMFIDGETQQLAKLMLPLFSR